MASTPFSRGIVRSTTATSGPQLVGQLDRDLAVLGLGDDLDVAHRLQAQAHALRTMVWSSASSTRIMRERGL